MDLPFGSRAILFPLAGGALIGISVSILLLCNGRVGGVSGIMGRWLRGPLEPTDADDGGFWRSLFLAGLIFGGFLAKAIGQKQGFDFFGDGSEIGMVRTVCAGLLVGVGTLMGSGCTSGHGVCGISRFSIRSIVATLTFIAAGIATVGFFEQVLK